MLFMVIEHFKDNARHIGERFTHSGRMLPEDVTYLASWQDLAHGSLATRRGSLFPGHRSAEPGITDPGSFAGMTSLTSKSFQS